MLRFTRNSLTRSSSRSYLSSIHHLDHSRPLTFYAPKCFSRSFCESDSGSISSIFNADASAGFGSGTSEHITTNTITSDSYSSPSVLKSLTQDIYTNSMMDLAFHRHTSIRTRSPLPEGNEYGSIRGVYDDITPEFYATLEDVFGVAQYSAAAAYSPSGIPVRKNIKGIVHGERKRDVFPLHVDVKGGGGCKWVFFIADERVDSTTLSSDIFPHTTTTGERKEGKEVCIEGITQDVELGSANVVGRDWMAKAGCYLVRLGGDKVKMAFRDPRGEVEDDGVEQRDDAGEGGAAVWQGKLNGKANRIVLQKVRTAELTPRIMIGGRMRWEEKRKGGGKEVE